MEKGRNCSQGAQEQFLLFSTVFCNLILDFCVKTRTRFSLRDKRLFEITEVEITGVDCIYIYTPCNFSPLGEISGSIELLENSLTFEGVSGEKLQGVYINLRFSKLQQIFRPRIILLIQVHLKKLNSREIKKYQLSYIRIRSYDMFITIY